MSKTETPGGSAAAAGAVLERHREAGLDVTVLERDGLREHHITLTPLVGEQPSGMVWRLQQWLREAGAQVVKHDVFGMLNVRDELQGCLQRVFEKASWPLTWVQGAPGVGQSVAGMQVFAVVGAEVEPVYLGKRLVGRVFRDRWAKHCMLGDLRPVELGQPQTGQAWQVFENLESALSQVGMGLSEVVRTWLFLDDILSWYGGFNEVRTEVYSQRGLFAKGVPASTGVGGRNSLNAALVAGAWAVQPLRNSVCIEELPSPLQCPAPSYGSGFSRAMQVSMPNHRRVLVSGTASIEPGGQTAHVGDVKSQIDLSMAVVEAILASRRLSFGDVTRATAYFRDIADGPLFGSWCAARQLQLPAVVTQCDICRDDLLFEVEVDAMAVESKG